MMMEKGENDSEFWINKGNELKKEGKFEDAICCYDKAITIDSTNLTTFNQKGHVLLLLGKMNEAIDCYNRIIGLSPDNPGGWSGKGLVLKHMEKYEESINCLNKALELKPNNKWIVEEKAEVLYRIGLNLWGEDPEECVINLENALQLGLSDISNKATAHAILGNIYHQKFDRNSDAIVEYEKAFEIDEQSEEELLGKDLRDMIVPELADCYGNEACELIRNENQIDKARELCQKGLLLDETSLVCKVGFAESYWAQKNWLGAIEAYNKVDIESLEESLIITVCSQLVGAYSNIDDFDGLAKYCRMSLVTDNKSEQNLLSDSNREFLTRSLVNSNYNIAIKLLREEEYDPAIKILDELLEYDPKYIDGLYLKGYYYLIKKNADSALEYFEKCLQIDADYIDALVGKGEALYYSGELDKAVEYCDKALDVDPNHENAHEVKSIIQSAINKKTENGPFEEIIEKGRNLALNEDFTEAIECFDKVLELNPNHKDCLLFKGVALYYLKKYAESNEYFDALLETNPEHSEAWTYKGRCCIILRDYNNAIEYLNKADELNPRDDEILRLKELVFSYLDKEQEARQPKIEIINNPEEIKEIKSKISVIRSKINSLTKDRTKKFSEAGEMAYSKCMGNAPELTAEAQTELDNILAIETLISKTNQEMEKAKGGQKKSGFFGKLSDTISSTAKQGKLKVELYNHGRNKNNSINDFGQILWESHEKGSETFPELSDIWQAIGDIEQQIHKKEDEIDNLNKLLG